MRQGTPKVARPAPEGGPDGAKWAHLGPFLATLDALLATWGVLLRVFMHCFRVFINIYAFLLKINGKSSKIHKITLTIIDFAQKDRKSA